MRAAVLLLLASGASVAQQFHAGAGIGVGSAYDVAGARVEFGVDRLSLLLGFGMGTASHDLGHGLSAGARWWLARPDAGPSLGAHVLAWRDPARSPYEGSTSIVMASATFTWRWRRGPVYADVGVGPAVVLESDRLPLYDYGPYGGALSRYVAPFFDLDIGFGVAF